MSRAQAALLVLELRDRCDAFTLQKQEDGSASQFSGGIVFGSNAMDNPRHLNFLRAVDGDAALIVSALVGNTVLVAACATIAFIIRHIVKPSFLCHLQALQSRLETAQHPSSTNSAPSLALPAVRGLLSVIHMLPSEAFPTSMYTSYTLLVQPSITAALLIAAHSSSVSGAAPSVSVIGAVLGICWLMPWLWFSYCVILRDRPLALATSNQCEERGYSVAGRSQDDIFAL
jgi:hypothetical protein